MILYIDTSDFHNLNLNLITETGVKEFATEVAFNENYKTNEFLEKFLKRNGVTPNMLSKIIVCSGPGSFTGIRVGVSLAQALGFALNIPVLTIPKSKVPADLNKINTIKLPDKNLLNYGQKPNITKSKKAAR